MEQASSSGWCYHIKKVYRKGVALTHQDSANTYLSVMIKGTGGSGHERRMEMDIFFCIFLKILYLKGIFSIVT